MLLAEEAIKDFNKQAEKADAARKMADSSVDKFQKPKDVLIFLSS